MFCFKCGKEIRNDSVFCEACGARLKDDLIHAQPVPAGENAPKRGVLLLALVAVVALVVIVALFFFRQNVPEETLSSGNSYSNLYTIYDDDLLMVSRKDGSVIHFTGHGSRPWSNLDGSIYGVITDARELSIVRNSEATIMAHDVSHVYISPMGESIAYTDWNKDSDYANLFVLWDGEVRKLSENYAMSGIFSPNSKHLAYVEKNAFNYSLMLYDGTQSRELLHQEGFPAVLAVSDDGTMTYYANIYLDEDAQMYKADVFCIGRESEKQICSLDMFFLDMSVQTNVDASEVIISSPMTTSTSGVVGSGGFISCDGERGIPVGADIDYIKSFGEQSYYTYVFTQGLPRDVTGSVLYPIHYNTFSCHTFCGHYFESNDGVSDGGVGKLNTDYKMETVWDAAGKVWLAKDGQTITGVTWEEREYEPNRIGRVHGLSGKEDEISTNAIIKTLRSSPDGSSIAYVTDDGKLYFVGEKNEPISVSVQTLSVSGSLYDHHDYLYSYAWTNENDALLYVADQTLHLYKDGKDAIIELEEADDIYALSPDNMYCAFVYAHKRGEDNAYHCCIYRTVDGENFDLIADNIYGDFLNYR